MDICGGADRLHLPFVLLGLIAVVVFLLILPLRSTSRRSLPWGLVAGLLVVGSSVTFVNAVDWSMRLGPRWFPWVEKAALLQCALSMYFTRIAYRRGNVHAPIPPADGSQPVTESKT